MSINMATWGPFTAFSCRAYWRLRRPRRSQPRPHPTPTCCQTTRTSRSRTENSPRSSDPALEGRLDPEDVHYLAQFRLWRRKVFLHLSSLINSKGTSRLSPWFLFPRGSNVPSNFPSLNFWDTPGTRQGVPSNPPGHSWGPRPQLLGPMLST